MHLLWLIFRSIYLDVRLFKTSVWNLLDRVDFLLKKYFLYIKYIFTGFQLGLSYVRFRGLKIYYGSKYGLADFQSMLTRLWHLLDIAEVHDVKTVVDVGANVGFSTLMFHYKYNAPEIYSFEPVPQVFSCLQKNTSDFPNISIYNKAIAASKGESKMSFDTSDALISSFSPMGSIRVSCVSLNDFLKDRGISVVDILKIDVEGFEHLVLIGATEMLARTRYLLMEITILDNSNYTISSLLKRLATDEYEFQLLGFRNYGDTAEGPIPVMDVIMKNILFSEK